MIVIFIGPPFSGKDTQSKLLASKLNLPVFGMGHLIREAYDANNKTAIEAYENYSMKGLHVPISLKFNLLKNKMNNAKKGFILDNFPANLEDFNTLNNYLKLRSLKIDVVFSLLISQEEMIKRIKQRGRRDDDLEIILKRREIQDKDRVPVINYYKKIGLLEEINSEKEIEIVQKDILEKLRERGIVND